MANYTQTLSTSINESSKIMRSGTGIGTRLYYSLGGTPELWREEPSKLKISINDSITGRTRILNAIISDPRNVKESIYSPYKRVKVVEYLTNLTIFQGRVEISTPKWDNQYGQILQITARDYSYELFERKVSSNYSSVPGASKRSVIINQLIQDYRYDSNSITTNIEASGSSDTITRNYTKSGRMTMELIEELAKEDPWTNSTWDKVWTYIASTYIDETTDANNVTVADVPLMNASTDYLYLGQNNPFIGANFDLSTNGSYGTITWQYYSGTWKNLTKLNNYDFTSDGEEKWSLPSDWITNSVNGTTRYWVRCSVSSKTTQAIATQIICIRGFGYDYYVDDSQVFQYFRRCSRPSGGPVTSGLTVALSEAPTASKRAMMHDYNFSEQPAEIVTRVKVYGTDNTGTEVSYTATDSDLETTLKVIKAKEEYVWGADMSNADLTIYCTNRANALLTQRASQGLIRGEFKILRYPYFGTAGSEVLVRVGDLIHIHCAPKNIDEDYLVLEVKYEEPNGFSIIKVVSNIYGRAYSPFETASILQGLRTGSDISLSSARIGDLMVNNAQIGSCSISKLTAGNLTVTGTITTGKFVTGAAGTNRIEIDSSYVAGYSAANVLQFYLSSVDGKAYAGGGKVVLDSTGITISGVAASTAALFLKDSTGTLQGDFLGSATYGMLMRSEANRPIYFTAGSSITLSAGTSISLSGTYIDASVLNYIKFPQVAGNPGTESEGWVWYDTTNHVIKYYNGTIIKTIATV